MQPITLSVDASDLNRVKAFLAAYSGQLPFATSLALNRTARDVQAGLNRATTTAFTDPVAFTRKAFRYSQSTKANLVAEVFPSQDRPYFDPQTFGGTRFWKNYEGLLRGLARTQGAGLPEGKLSPTSLARNAAGNPRRALFGQIQAAPERFVFGTPRGGNRGPRSPGVYRRTAKRLQALFVVVPEPRYRPRFPMERVGTQVAAQVFPSHLSAAIDRAVASAR